MVLRGGFAGLGAADPNVQDPVAYATVLSGDLLENDDGTTGGRTDNSRHVVTPVGGAAIDGFRIRSGWGDPAISSEWGAGIYLSTGTHTISRCVLEDHHAHDGAALIVLEDASATISECEFRNNHSGSNGGAVLIDKTAPFVARSSCIFSGNGAEGPGGALSIRTGSGPPVNQRLVIDCQFIDNVGEVGGAIHMGGLGGKASAELRGCLFAGNVATTAVGGAFLNPVASVSGCTFLSNAGLKGVSVAGGLAFGSSAPEARVVSCVFRDNVSLSFGAAVSFLVSGGTACSMRNCAVAGNVCLGTFLPSAIHGSLSLELDHCTINGSIPLAVRLEHSRDVLDIANSIVHGNEDAFQNLLDIDIKHSLIEGGWTGPGNIDGDPLFAAPDTGDLRLLAGSPAIDAASAALLPPDALDLDQDGDTSEPLPLDADGMPRVLGTAPDMGAYEGVATAPVPPTAAASDVPPLESVLLDPESKVPTSADGVLAEFRNLGEDSVDVVLTELAWPPVAVAGGWSELGLVARVETSQDDGLHFTRVVVPISYARAEPSTRAIWVC